MLIANEILAAGPESRIYKSLREKEGMCYYANSMLYRAKSVIFVQSGIGVKMNDFETAASIIKSELECAKKGFTDEEIKTAKQRIIRKLSLLPDNSVQMMDFYLSNHVSNDGSNLIQTIENIRETNNDECNGVLKNAWIDTLYFLSPEAENAN